MKKVLEFLVFCYLVGEMLTVYTMIACVTFSEPFPAWFHGAWVFYCVTMLIALSGVVAALVWVSAREIKARSRKNRRLGMVRMDQCTGRWYCEGARR